ncbi:MAG: OB-fold nucleic acid binding domain-containing protein [Lachnospiraceae bacterium]|nr:OB-fold nucleic acid binding domain-containing protein [Lachnospiraceae bacterium]
MRNRKKVCIFLALVLMYVTLSAALPLSFKEMALDTEKNQVYQNDSADVFLIKSKASPDKAKEIYHKKNFVLYGKVKGRDTSKKQLKLGIVKDRISNDTLTCKWSKATVTDAVAELRNGDVVKVYGELSVGMLDGKWSMSVDKIEKTFATSVSDAAFSALSGRTIDGAECETRTLNQGKIKLYVPKEWKSVEKNIVDNKLGTMEGYQYRLNEIDQHSIVPESLFVCYFSNEQKLLRTGDKGRTEAIEQEIIKNICPETDLVGNVKTPKRTQKKNTYYGAEYHYYQEEYTSEGGQSYRAEFIFQPDGTNGFIVYLYVYLEKDHLDDVMIFLRMVEP